MKGRIKRNEDITGNKFPIIGKIKVGEKVERGQKTFPQSLDYFRVTGKYETHFKKTYGDQPSKIHIVFISDDFRDSCFERFECRDKAGKLAAYGDGEETFVYDPATNDYKKKEAKRGLAALGKWEAILTIRFICLGVDGVFGLFQFDTKADKSSIPQIRDTFDTVLENVGTVINVPFDLIVDKVKSQKPDQKHLFPVVTMVPNISKENQDKLSLFLTQGGDVKALGTLNEAKVKRLKV